MTGHKVCYSKIVSCIVVTPTFSFDRIPKQLVTVYEQVIPIVIPMLYYSGLASSKLLLVPATFATSSNCQNSLLTFNTASATHPKPRSWREAVSTNSTSLSTLLRIHANCLCPRHSGFWIFKMYCAAVPASAQSTALRGTQDTAKDNW